MLVGVQRRRDTAVRHPGDDVVENPDVDDARPVVHQADRVDDPAERDAGSGAVRNVVLADEHEHGTVRDVNTGAANRAVENLKAVRLQPHRRGGADRLQMRANDAERARTARLKQNQVVPFDPDVLERDAVGRVDGEDRVGAVADDLGVRTAAFQRDVVAADHDRGSHGVRARAQTDADWARNTGERRERSRDGREIAALADGDRAAATRSQLGERREFRPAVCDVGGDDSTPADVPGDERQRTVEVLDPLRRLGRRRELGLARSGACRKRPVVAGQEVAAGQFNLETVLEHEWAGSDRDCIARLIPAPDLRVCFGRVCFHGWQWLFLIEGAPAFLLSFAVLKLLPDGPKDASWLTVDEKKAIGARLAAEDSPGRRELWRALCDPRLLALGLANFAFQSCAYGVVLWLPQIVQAMGFSILATGFVISLPFVGGAGAMLLCGRSSSIRGELDWHVALPWLLAASGFAAASVLQSNLVVLSALTLGLISIYAAYGPFFSLPSSFLRGTAAAGGIGLFSTLGSLGGFFGPVLIGVLKQGSGNYATGLAAVAFGFALSAVIVLAVGRVLAPHPVTL